MEFAHPPSCNHLCQVHCNCHVPRVTPNWPPLISLRANRVTRHSNEIKKMNELFGIITTCTKIFSGNADLTQLYTLLQRQVYETTFVTFQSQTIAISTENVADYPTWFTSDPSVNQILTLERQDCLYFTTLFFLTSLQLPSASLQLRQSYLSSINFFKITGKILTLLSAY